VRSRSALDLESNLARTHLSSNPSHPSYSASHPIEHSRTVDPLVQGSNSLTRDWSHISVSPAPGRVLVSGKFYLRASLCMSYPLISNR